MVASLLLWNSSMENKVEVSKQITENKGLEERITKVETTKLRGRKSSKTSQKKLPQRGLGVAQLERLRLQERLKKMPEVDQVQAQVQTAQNLYPRFQFFPFLDPKKEVLDSFARFSPVNYGQPSSHSQSFGFQPYNGFAGGVTGCSGGNSLFPGQFQVDRLRITSQELSSTQNIHCLSDRCDICLKKKHINGDNSGFNGGRTQYTEKMMPIDCDFLGLNLGRNSNVDGFKGVRRACHSGLTVDEEVEVVAVHRKGKSVGGSSVLMEYEFFPHKDGSSSSFNKESSITEAGGPAEAAIMGEASSSSNTNLIDLSLKLSC